ncbi:hypothetical protein EV426DRAFT_243477 [Tirmania nivea]|nr:hypothetical protein EV426DRAFT_243477 [Tirmania nivea]
MSEVMMPISADALHYRTLLFELSKLVIIPADKFNEIWPYVDTVYRTLRGEVLRCNGTLRVQKYECRLCKSIKSSTAKVATEDKIIKRQHSSIRDKHLCHVQIKVSKPVDGTAVTIERLLMMFEECGMEVYETMGTVWVEEDSDRNDVEMTSRVIQVRARCEQVQQQLYAIQESMEHLNLDNTVRSQRMEEWVNHIQ